MGRSGWRTPYGGNTPAGASTWSNPLTGGYSASTYAGSPENLNKLGPPKSWVWYQSNVWVMRIRRGSYLLTWLPFPYCFMPLLQRNVQWLLLLQALRGVLFGSFNYSGLDVNIRAPLRPSLSDSNVTLRFNHSRSRSMRCWTKPQFMAFKVNPLNWLNPSGSFALLEFQPTPTSFSPRPPPHTLPSYRRCWLLGHDWYYLLFIRSRLKDL